MGRLWDNLETIGQVHLGAAIACGLLEGNPVRAAVAVFFSQSA